MLREQERTSKLEEPTDAEAYTAIRYLEEDSDSDFIQAESDPIVSLLGISLVILLLGCIGSVWIYQWTH